MIAHRDFNYDNDLAAIKRIWREVGWVDASSEKAVDSFFACGRTRVGTIDDVPECSVHTVTGTMRLGQQDLPLCAVTAVTTSRIARGHAFAQKLTAEQLIAAKQNGAQVAALGMFDQGFYDKLGFGTGAYDHELTFDPALLQVPGAPPTPVRLAVADAADCHAAMLGRNKCHGAVSLSPAVLLQAEFEFEEDGFGLGYRDGDQQLTHFVWLSPKGERGPYRVKFCGYQNTDQLLDLLRLLRSLADQVYSVTMIEPPELQLQSLLRRPLRSMVLTRGSEHAAGIRALAWWQARLLDVPAGIATLPQVHAPLQFNLQVTDPLADMLPGDDHCQGSYVVRLAGTHQTTSGTDDQLPTLAGSINAISRWVLGVAPATSLAVTDDLTAPADLLAALDAAVHVARPSPGWDF